MNTERRIRVLHTTKVIISSAEKQEMTDQDTTLDQTNQCKPEQKENIVLSNSLDETQYTGLAYITNMSIDYSQIRAHNEQSFTGVPTQEVQHEIAVENTQQPGVVALDIQNENESSQNDAEDPAQRLREILKSSAHFRFRRAFFLCITIFLALMSLEPILAGGSFSPENFMIICGSFLGYILIENIIMTISHDILPWKLTENLFDTIDIILVLIFCFSIGLKVNGLVFPLKVVSLLPVLNMMIYLWRTKAPKTHREALTVIRAFYSIQIVLLAFKIDGDIGLTWIATLSVVWLFLALVTFYFVFSAIMLVYAVIMNFYKYEMPLEIDNKTQIRGFLWMTLYSSLGPILLIGVAAKNFQQDELLRYCYVIGKYMSISVAVLTLIAYSWVIEFLIKSNTEEVDYQRQLGLLPSKANADRVSIEKKNVYLMKLSSTYFSALNESVFTRNKNNVEDLNKRAEQKVTREKFNKGPIKSSRPDLSQQEKCVMSSPCHGNTSVKICLTEAEVDAKEVGKVEEEELCYICCNKASDAVIKECGHGGVCVECAIQVLKGKGHCMQCRKEAKTIVKIDISSTFKNIVKGFETITIKPVQSDSEDLSGQA